MQAFGLTAGEFLPVRQPVFSRLLFNLPLFQCSFHFTFSATQELFSSPFLTDITLPLNFVWLKQHLREKRKGFFSIALSFYELKKKKKIYLRIIYTTLPKVFTYHLLSLHSWAPQCSKGNIKAHSLRLTNEFCSEVKYLSDLTSTEINSNFKFPFSTCCPFLVISAIMLGCFGCFHRSFKWVALAGLLILDLAVRLLSGLCLSSHQPQSTHFFSSMVLPSSITKLVRVFHVKPCAARPGSHGFSLPGPGSRLLLVATSFSAFLTHAATQGKSLCSIYKCNYLKGSGHLKSYHLFTPCHGKVGTSCWVAKTSINKWTQI